VKFLLEVLDRRLQLSQQLLEGCEEALIRRFLLEQVLHRVERSLEALDLVLFRIRIVVGWVAEPATMPTQERPEALLDIGTEGPEPVDYPDIAAQVARLVARKEVDAAIVIDGAGIGSSIAANKIDGARAAMCTDKTLARYSREHNGANVLALGATLISVDDAKAIVDTWIATPMGEARYLRRLAKIRALERMP